MSTVSEQILEHALYLHHGTISGDDLSYRVLLRWRAEGRSDSPPARRATRLLQLVAAALIAAVALALWFRSGEEPILFTLAEPVQVQRGLAWSPTSSSEIRSGDAVLLEDSLHLDMDGTSLVLQPETMATFDDSGISLRLGELQLVKEGDDRFEINAPLIRVRVDGSARLIMQIRPRERGTTMSLRETARQIYLHTAPTALVLSLTLVQGRAQMESEGVSFDLPVGETVEQAWIEEQDPAGTKVTPVPVTDPTADKPALAALMKEVGTWDVEMVTYDPTSGQEMTVRAVEVSKAGPGGAWLITDLTISLPSWDNSMHTVLGVDGEDPERYIGTSVASSGGMMILEGTFDGETRTMYARMPAEPDVVLDLRMVYSWVTDDERVVAAQQKGGEDWVTAYEFRYRRRK